MPAVNVYVRKKLKTEMDKREDRNWSKIAADAFREEIDGADATGLDIRDFLRLARRIAGRQANDRETLERAKQIVLVAEWRRKQGVKPEDIKV